MSPIYRVKSLRANTFALILFGVSAVFCFLGCANKPKATVAVAPKAHPLAPGWEQGALNRAGDFLNIGLDCLNDSLWFEAGENLDSAMVQITQLDNQDSLDAATRIAAKALKDTIQTLMVRVASVSGEVEELNPITELTDEEMGESGDSSSHAFDSLSNKLDYSLYDLPLPQPLPGQVQKALAYFTGPGRKVFARWLSRKPRYEAYVRDRLEARGMPKDLFYLAMVESGLNPRAYSHAAAAGMWQFISGTGRRYGLMDDYWIDPRRDIVAATEAALSYLQQLFTEFGDWHLAMASYNCGENRVRRQLAADSTQTYWTMKLPAETRFYVPKILAAMILGHEPERFGFVVSDSLQPLAFDTITVTDCLPLKDVAKAVGASEDEIMDLNPSLRRWCTPPNRKSHILYLPSGKRESFAEAYAAMDKEKLISWKQHQVARGDNLGSIAAHYGVSTVALKSANRLKSNRLHIGQTLIIPVSIGGQGSGFEAEVLRESEGRPKRQLEVTYRVRRGDNLFDIARRFATTVDRLRSLNGLGRKDQIMAGQILRISQVKAKPVAREKKATVAALPPGKAQYHLVEKGETLYGLSRSLGVSQSDLTRWNNLEARPLKAGDRLTYFMEPVSVAPEATNASTPQQYYVVRSGDTLWDISQRFQSTVDQIRDLNNGLASVLRPGTRIRVR